MAWDPSCSPWDWESDGVTVSSHATGTDAHKLPIASWPGKTALAQIKLDGPFHLNNRALCSSEERSTVTNSQSAQVDLRRDGSLLSNRVVTPAMANMPGSLAFNDAASYSDFGLHTRMPIVTTCIGSGAFIGGNSHGNGSLQSIVEKRYDESQGSVEHKNTEGLGAYEKQVSAGNRMKNGFYQPNVGRDKLCHVENTNGREHLSTAKYISDKSIESICNSDKAKVMDEQHSSTAMGSAGSGDSLTGLQLGKRTYPLDVATTSVAKATQKASYAAKKARGGPAPAQMPRCQVEGCKLDLSSAKDYHRRHKVCEPHSKAGKVVVANLEQRFCQQCSRFHLLSEFDETKRSCRRRLAGHNKRRRKPQPDPLELQARLRSSLEEWPFFYQSRFPRLPCWQDACESHSNILWPKKLMQYHDHSNFDHSLQTLGTDPFTKALSPSLTRDKFPLLLLQSPRTYMPMGLCDPRVQDYPPELISNSNIDNGLSLVSSSIGGGVFTGLETTPVTEVTRVSDSGRALSLLSLHSQCSQAPDMVSLDLSSLSNTMTINHIQHVQDRHDSSQQFLLQGPHPYCQDFSTSLSMSSNLHVPAVDVHEEANVINSDKHFFECPFFDNLDRQSSYEGSQNTTVLNMQMQSQGTTAEVKQTQDLMQLAPFPVAHAHRQCSSLVSNLECSALSDSHFSSETSFLRF